MCINPEKMSNKNAYLSAYLVGGRRKYLTAENISVVLKFQPPHWIIRLWKGFQYTEWTLINWNLEELMHCRLRDTSIEIYKKWGYGEGKPLSSTYDSSYIVLRRECWLQWSKTLKFSTSLAGHIASWLVSLEPQWLMIISLLQRQHKNEYDRTVTKLLGNEAVDRWMKRPREGQDGIVFESRHLRSLE